MAFEGVMVDGEARALDGEAVAFDEADEATCCCGGVCGCSLVPVCRGTFEPPTGGGVPLHRITARTIVEFEDTTHYRSTVGDGEYELHYLGRETFEDSGVAQCSSDIEFTRSETRRCEESYTTPGAAYSCTCRAIVGDCIDRGHSVRYTIDICNKQAGTSCSGWILQPSGSDGEIILGGGVTPATKQVTRVVIDAIHAIMELFADDRGNVRAILFGQGGGPWVQAPVTTFEIIEVQQIGRCATRIGVQWTIRYAALASAGGETRTVSSMGRAWLEVDWCAGPESGGGVLPPRDSVIFNRRTTPPMRTGNVL